MGDMRAERTSVKGDVSPPDANTGIVIFPCSAMFFLTSSPSFKKARYTSNPAVMAPGRVNAFSYMSKSSVDMKAGSFAWQKKVKRCVEMRRREEGCTRRS
jgi:hypothetical protein